MHPNQRAVINHIKYAMQQQNSPYKVFTLPNGNFREVHFSLRGPKGTIFEGGLYHGKLVLSDKYPYEAPDMVFIQESGKFEIGGAICLSFRENPNLWSPSLGINGLIRSLQSLFGDEEIQGIKIIRHPDKEQVARYVEQSRAFKCSACGCDHSKFYDDIQKVTDEFDSLHQQK
ncbi:Ubiquitin-conjugating_enzyme E2-28.4 kDa [Hexamita inflata]|uniref:Ubiquitin-conjugating enzyme E2-28.4 kDa n=1 Tax=Hexamita inflata TaxID=28002 RepID=A0AA86TZQ4_9EUKA|nr:Ubiquitin-conjugating enzyme E2-28.4 kDa [Hexamita inflata]CAI9934661.1 Ubiquitin-conjugating enzyme E2-28.4 kDa [Hexamita inflata]CAI9939044.1 Ubiquitin-conjugating enzyme E2-28.4 kDa [Hexamita inflata]